MQVQRKITFNNKCLLFELEACTTNPFHHCFVCGCFHSKYHWRLDIEKWGTGDLPEICEMNYVLPEYDAFDSVYTDVMPFEEKHLEYVA